MILFQTLLGNSWQQTFTTILNLPKEDILLKGDDRDLMSWFWTHTRAIRAIPNAECAFFRLAMDAEGVETNFCLRHPNCLTCI
jgi:hypothetical protein